MLHLTLQSVELIFGITNYFYDIKYFDTLRRSRQAGHNQRITKASEQVASEQVASEQVASE
ncbi:MAG: hypothetical protein OXP09_21205, partial [Gammaproteobacteria bacterium]|nr:hypothetical protein [Gammaproteobacteria bacterium]